MWLSTAMASAPLTSTALRISSDSGPITRSSILSAYHLLRAETALPASAALHWETATVKPGAPGPGTWPTIFPGQSDGTISNWAPNIVTSSTTDLMRSGHVRKLILQPLGTLGFR